MTNTETDKLLLIAIQASINAGKIIMQYYSQSYNVEYKQDDSPLTTADLKAHYSINSELSETGLPVLSEEGKNISYDERKQWQTFWLVDPLDGTKEFISHNGEFTVNIALINGNVPTIGVIYVPVTKTLYFSTINHGSFKVKIGEDISESNIKLSRLMEISNKLPLNYKRDFTIMGSRSHSTPENDKLINNLVSQFNNINVITAGSSLKFCLIAEGKADLYPRLGTTMEWDTAAGHAICKYSNCIVTDYKSGNELTYNKPDLRNPHFLVVTQSHVEIVAKLDRPT